MSEIFYQSATELAAQIRQGKVSAEEVMQAHLARIAQVNPALNAIVTLDEEGALRAARQADQDRTQGKPLGPLHGLPVAHKDLLLTKGMRTTYGSRVHENYIPTRSSLPVERQQEAGAISIGKTNTPEFGAGSQTFNAVFGATRNPWNTALTCGGSSGGAAVALAAGMVPLADGTDMGGSLRCPANFCNVLGLRPTPGRVPQWPALDTWSTLSVAGPMARNAQDLGLYLSVLAGPDPRDPKSLADAGSVYRQDLQRDFKGVRVAFSADLGGLPVDASVKSVLNAQRHCLEELGCIVEEAAPDLSGASEVFQTLRALDFELRLGAVLDAHPGVLKDTVVWNIEQGRKLTGPQIARALKQKSVLYERMQRFMQQYEFFICPVNQVPPFPIEQPYVTHINGVEMENYIAWMLSCFAITVVSHPALSMPCGFTADGLPVGMQVVGRYQDELGLLQLAHAFEQVNTATARRPSC